MDVPILAQLLKENVEIFCKVCFVVWVNMKKYQCISPIPFFLLFLLWEVVGRDAQRGKGYSWSLVCSAQPNPFNLHPPAHLSTRFNLIWASLVCTCLNFPRLAGRFEPLLSPSQWNGLNNGGAGMEFAVLKIYIFSTSYGIWRFSLVAWAEKVGKVYIG